GERIMTTYRLKACPVGILPVPGWECFFGHNDTTMQDLAFYVWIVRAKGLIGLIDAGLPQSPRDLQALDAANQKVDKRCVYRELYFTEGTWAFLRKLLIEDRLHLVDEETQICPGIFFETTGGHHPGSAAVRVSTRGGVVGILETAFVQRNVDEELPIGVAEDAAECRRAIQRYKRICDIVAADHEPLLAQHFTGT